MTAIDPICKMEVEEKTAKWTSEYKGKKYFLRSRLQEKIRFGSREMV